MIMPMISLTNQSSWMSSLKDSSYLSELSIPGTHQTMTFETSASNWMKTQTKTLEEQFSMGIRFFDIRLTYLETIGHEGNLVATQGNTYLKSFLSDILSVCQKLIIQNPSETILLSLKREHDILSDKFIPLMLKLISENEEYWYLGKTIPTMKEVRGKIVLLKRFKESNYGIDLSIWESNSHFHYTNTDLVSYDIQDKYKGFDRGNEEKKYDDNVYPQLLRAIHDSDLKKLYMNFANGSEPIWPSTLSGVTNPKIFNYLKSAEIGRYGIITLDYPENVKYLPLAIIKTNHFKLIEDNQYYTLSPKHISSMVLDVVNAHNKMGLEVVINRLEDKVSQVWKVEDSKDGYFYLTSMSHPEKVLSVIKTENEPNYVTLWENKQKDNQKWKFNLFKEGFYTISPKHLPHLVLEVKEKKTIANAIVLVNPYITDNTEHKMYSQRWIVMKIPMNNEI